jgi:hypothetical protein
MGYPKSSKQYPAEFQKLIDEVVEKKQRVSVKFDSDSKAYSMRGRIYAYVAALNREWVEEKNEESRELYLRAAQCQFIVMRKEPYMHVVLRGETPGVQQIREALGIKEPVNDES